ncbi:MAG TPA: hypothetical protein ENI23_06250 [bacterium]|nr:hypothetical protein [bacterium]
MNVNCEKLIEQIGTPDEEGVVKWELRLSHKGEEGDFCFDIIEERWLRVRPSLTYRLSIFATPIERKSKVPQVPNKVKVKALLTRGERGVYWLHFSQPVLIRGTWKTDTCEDVGSFHLSEIQPGECVVIEVEVDKIAPELE